MNLIITTSSFRFKYKFIYFCIFNSVFLREKNGVFSQLLLILEWNYLSLHYYHRLIINLLHFYSYRLFANFNSFIIIIVIIVIFDAFVKEIFYFVNFIAVFVVIVAIKVINFISTS